MNDGSGQTAWSFDLASRPANIAKTINGVRKTAAYTYNLDGTVASLTDFSGSTTRYSYNGVGLAISAIDSTGIKFATGAAYTAAGQMSEIVRGAANRYAGLTSTNEFTNRLLPALISAQTPAATVLSLTYGYGSAGNNNGNIVTIGNNLNFARSQIYGYDQINWLASAQSGTLWGDMYTYDPWGNLLQKTPMPVVSNAESVSFLANAENQLIGFAYDAAGDMTIDSFGNTMDI